MWGLIFLKRHFLAQFLGQWLLMVWSIVVWMHGWLGDCANLFQKADNTGRIKKVIPVACVDSLNFCQESRFFGLKKVFNFFTVRWWHMEILDWLDLCHGRINPRYGISYNYLLGHEKRNPYLYCLWVQTAKYSTKWHEDWVCRSLFWSIVMKKR